MVFAYQNCAPLESSHEKSTQGSTSSGGDDTDVADTPGTPAPTPTPTPTPTPDPVDPPDDTPPPETLCTAGTTPSLSNPSNLIYTVYSGYGGTDQGSSGNQNLTFDFTDNAGNSQHECADATNVLNNGNNKIDDVQCTTDSSTGDMSMRIAPDNDCRSGSVTIAAAVQAVCNQSPLGTYVSNRINVVVNVVNTCMAEDFVDPPSRAREAGMGYDVAISGNTFVTAADRDSQWGTSWSGTAEVYSRSGTNLNHQQTLVPTDVPFDGNDDRLAFGEMASIDVTRGGGNDFIATGAPLSGNGAGAVYVWKHNGTSWALDARILPEASAGLGNFGRSVAIDGNRLIVGAPLSPNDGASGTAYRGNAYVYTYDGTNWNLQATLGSDNPIDDEYFGFSVALDGNNYVVGAPLSDTIRTSDKGKVYYFSSGATTPSNVIQPAAAQRGSGFGHSVDFDGTRIIVGAPWSKDDPDNNGLSPRGQAFYLNVSNLSTAKELSLAGGDANGENRFGWDVAISGDKVLVGAPYDAGQNGTVFHYDISIGNYPADTTNYFQLDSTGGNDNQFGTSVAVEGNYGFIGSPLDNVGSGSQGVDAGSARMFELITPAYP